MANASRKKMGAGTQGKGSGSGAGTEIQKDLIGENQALDNRDKAGGTRQRGADTKGAQVDQYQENPQTRYSRNDQREENQR